VTLASIGRQIKAARNRLAKVMESAEQAAIEAHQDGMPETEIAKTLGVNRMTVRRWLGKQ
jgi:DNA invertase Pin-like site-specific DNA recombinase